MIKIFLSKQKITELKKQLRDLESSLKDQRDEAGKRGGLLDSWHETAAYGATQAAIEAKVKELKGILEKGEELPEKIASDKVVLGSWVEVKDDYGNVSKYRLVHPLEADPAKGLLSVKSPLGKLLLGKEKGDTANFNSRKLTIQSIS